MHIFFNRIFVAAKEFISALFLCFVLSPHAALAMPGFPGMENLSPEEMQQLEQELQAAAQQIDAYVSSLTPEEQAEFQRAVQEVEQMMNNMSQEELEQFFEQIVAAEMEQQQLQQGLPPVQPQQPMTLEHKPAPVVSKVPLTSAEEKALALLTSLLDATDKFLLKTDNILDIENRFKNWAKDNKLTGISATTSWEQQKNAIVDLRQHISDLKKTDLKTGKYLFIEPFIKNTGLYNQLEQLSKQLETYEPRIVVSKIEKLSDDAKTALRSTINAYGAGLESTKTDIKKLFDEIGPELAKIKEEEKKTTEKAQTEAAKGRQVIPGRTAGSVERGGYYGGGRGDYDEYGGYPYGRDHGYGDYGRPREGAEAGKEKGKPKGGGKGGGKGKGKEEEGDKEKGKKGGKEGKEAKTEGPKQPKEIVTCPVDGGEQLNGQYELIASNYRYIDDLLKENTDVLNIVERLKEKNSNPQFALYTFPALERRLKRLNELIETYKKEVAKIKDADKTKEKEKQAAALNKLTELHEKQANLNTLTEQLEKVMEAISTAEDTDPEERDAFIRSMSPAARYAYFKDELKLSKEDTENPENNLKPVDDGIKKQLPATSLVSLTNIYNEIEKLKDAVPKKKVEKEKTEEEKEEPKRDETAAPRTTPTTPRAPQAKQA
jgi:hypothetical protein